MGVFEENVIDLPFFTEEECKEIYDWAFKIEQELIDAGHGDYKPKPEFFDNVTTSNHHKYNFFSFFPQYADRFADFCHQMNKDIEFPAIVQAWVNIYRKGQGIYWHNHQGTMGKSFSCNVFIGGPTTPGVQYKPFGQKTLLRENKVGHMHMFPCELFHRVAPNETDDPRVTVGMTIHSRDAINTRIMDQLAFNSREYRDTIILTKSHFEFPIEEQNEESKM